MALWIAPSALEVVARSRHDNVLFLGAIDVNGRVWIEKTAPGGVEGHADWLANRPDIDARRGFSFSFYKGGVSLHCWSGLNDPALAYNLEPEFEAEVSTLLGFADDVSLVVYRH